VRPSRKTDSSSTPRILFTLSTARIKETGTNLQTILQEQSYYVYTKWRHWAVFYSQFRLNTKHTSPGKEQSVCVPVGQQHCFTLTKPETATSQSQSQSYFTTDGQSVSMSWCRAQFGTFDQRYYFFFFKVTFLSYLGRPL
jgi:hypothetical protein